MAFVRVKPQSLIAMGKSVWFQRRIFALVRETVGKKWKVPDTDIIPRICIGDVGFSDRVCRELKTAPDVVISVDTSDRDLVSRLGEALKTKLEQEWIKGFGVFLRVEIHIDAFEVWGITYDPEATVKNNKK